MSRINPKNSNLKAEKISIVVVDDHTLFREGIEALLRNRGIKILDSVGNGAEGMARTLALNPDVVLLDLRMPDISGIAVVRSLREQGFNAPIAVLTMSQNKKDFMDCLQGGVKGYLLKDMDPDQLASSLRQIHDGQTVIAPAMKPLYTEIISERDPAASDNIVQKLTPREKQILALLAEGLSNKKIASRYNIADGTVKLHVKSILKKLNVHSRVEAAVIAIDEINRQALQPSDPVMDDPRSTVGETPAKESF